MERSLAAIRELHLAPNEEDRELVLLTDAKTSAAVLATRLHTIALSSEATKLLKRAFLEPGTVRVKDLVAERGKGSEDALSWIRDSSNDGHFQLVEEAPSKTAEKSRPIQAGDWIAAKDFGEKPGVPVEYPGTVTTAEINKSTVHWYVGDVSLEDKNQILGVGTEASVTAVGYMGIGLYPSPGGLSLGVHCGRCGMCGVCGTCSACGLCGGVDLAAGLIAFDAVVAAVAFANASSVFEGFRAI